MNFHEALSAIFNDGDRVARADWNGKTHATLDDGRLCVLGHGNESGWTDDGVYRPWTISEQDYFAEDWEVVE